MRHHALAAAATALLALTLAACSDAPLDPAPSTTSAPQAEPSPTFTEDGGADATVPSEDGSPTTDAPTPVDVDVDVESSFLNGTSMNISRALFTLDALVLADPLSMDGYTEGVYAPGPDAEEAGWPPPTLLARNCDVTSATLARDGSDVMADEQCIITTGVWSDPFTRGQITDPGTIAAVYVVPSAEVWRSGGAAWTDEQAGIYGSTQEALVAGIDPQARGDKGPDQWRPEDAGTWCPYAIRWIGVKNEFGLTLSSEEERETLREMLSTCEDAGPTMGV